VKKKEKKHTHITQKVKIYSEMQEIQNRIYNIVNQVIGQFSFKRINAV